MPPMAAPTMAVPLVAAPMASVPVVAAAHFVSVDSADTPLSISDAMNEDNHLPDPKLILS